MLKSEQCLFDKPVYNSEPSEVKPTSGRPTFKKKKKKKRERKKRKLFFRFEKLQINWVVYNANEYAPFFIKTDMQQHKECLFKL